MGGHEHLVDQHRVRPAAAEAERASAAPVVEDADLIGGDDEDLLLAVGVEGDAHHVGGVRTTRGVVPCAVEHPPTVDRRHRAARDVARRDHDVAVGRKHLVLRGGTEEGRQLEHVGRCQAHRPAGRRVGAADLHHDTEEFVQADLVAAVPARLQHAVEAGVGERLMALGRVPAALLVVARLGADRLAHRHRPLEQIGRGQRRLGRFDLRARGHDIVGERRRHMIAPSPSPHDRAQSPASATGATEGFLTCSPP